MSLRNIHFDVSLSQLESEKAVSFKDIRDLIKSKEDLENVLLSTKVYFETKEELLDFFDILLKYGFKENAISYFEELLQNSNDIEIVNGFNSLLKQ
ncbi:hypothetical protein [Caminibacter sp.]